MTEVLIYMFDKQTYFTIKVLKQMPVTQNVPKKNIEDH